MKRIAAIVCLVGLSRLFAAPCDAPYYIHGVTEYVRTASLGAAEEVLSEESSQLDPLLNGLTILDTNITYTVIKQFEGECGEPVQNPLVLWSRPAGGGSSFAEQTVTDLYTEMFDSNTVKLGSSGFDWWYAIGPALSSGHVRIDSARYVVGREGEDDLFSTWYGTAYLIDSTRQQSGLWGVAYQYFPLVSYYDSAQLDQQLLEGWRSEAWNGDDRRGKYELQLLKVDYDTIPAAVQFQARDRAPLALRQHIDGNVTVFDPLGRRLGRMPEAIAVERARGCYILRIGQGAQLLHLKDMRLAR